MQFNQTNKNAGDVNNVISHQGSVVQSVGDKNKIAVDKPKESFWSLLWTKIKSMWTSS